MSPIIEDLKQTLEAKLLDAKQSNDAEAVSFIEGCFDVLGERGYSKCFSCERYHHESELIGSKHEDRQCERCHSNQKSREETRQQAWDNRNFN